MNTEQQTAWNGGQALVRAMDFVTRCRTRDPLGDYLHIGDLQWWCRTDELNDQQNWHFWQQEDGTTDALALVVENQIVCLLHPDVWTQERYLSLHQWAVQHVRAQAMQQGEPQYEVSEEIASDASETSAWLEREGYTRQEKYFNSYRRSLTEPIPDLILPEGFTLRSIAGREEAAARAALQRDAFSSGGSKMYEQATSRQLAVMNMPHYDPQLDLMIIAPDGTPAAGCICWVDPVNHVGLFEPVGTRPQFRRQGLATALMLGGLQRLRERGMQAALVLGAHPGEEEKSTEFTSSRFVYEAVGFQLLRRIYTYHKIFDTAI